MHRLLKDVKRIVFAGDSLTDGAAWPDWVVATLVANGVPRPRLFNAGVAGNTAADIRARFQADIVSLQPDLVVLHCGSNDVNRGVSLESYQRDLAAVVRGTRQSGARVLLLTPPSMREPERDAKLQACCDVVRLLAQRYRCVVADIHEEFAVAARAGVELWGPDGVHHRIDGWRTMARGVLSALGTLNPLVEETIPEPGMLTDWRVSPPVPWQTGEPYPACPDAWTSYDGAPAVRESWWQVCWLDRGGVMPLGTATAGQGVGAFAETVIHSDDEHTALLRLGGSPPLAAWLNGALIWDNRALHGYHPDADRVRVSLRAGENRLRLFTTWVCYAAIDV